MTGTEQVASASPDRCPECGGPISTTDREAVCEECNASVDLAPRSQLFANSAEMSTPQPMPVRNETIIGSLDDHSMVVLKMHLIGKLRDACDEQCKNSNTDRPKGLYTPST